MVQLTECGLCSRGDPQLDVINRCIVVLLAGQRRHVVDKVSTWVSWCWEVVHNAGHPNEEQEEDEHHIEHEQGVKRHELHSLS